METFYEGVVKRRKFILIFFSVCFVICLFLQNLVSVNYDMNDYLPSDAKSTVALDVMQKEFDGGIPNARVMITDVTIPQALEYKEQIENVEGVTEVTWLDDSVDITTPLAVLDSDVVENYFKDNNALFSVTIDEDCRISAVDAIREIIGEDNAMTGSAVSTAVATTNTVSEIQKITVIAVIFVLVVLILTTTSWIEPFIVMIGLGIAIIINSGSNLIFGEISFVTNAAGSILQLAVSLDYSVFLIHRFEECRKENANVNEAMVTALCKSTTSILSSGLTTVIGFLALILMQFKIGPDLGLALAKGVAISLITVFLFMPSLILTTYKWLDKTRHKSFMPSFKGFGKSVYQLAIPKKVDEGAIALSPAVELSYLSEEQQKVLLDAMSLNDCTPSHAQSIRMKKSAQQGTLSSDGIYEIMSEEKANQTEHISFKVQDLQAFFPKNYTQKQMTETILKLLYDYHRKTERKRNSRDER